MEFAPFRVMFYNACGGISIHRRRRLNNCPADTASVFHFSFFIFTLFCFRSLFSHKLLLLNSTASPHPPPYSPYSPQTFETHTIIFETPVILMNKLTVLLSHLIV
jgi:hypothetical protein